MPVGHLYVFFGKISIQILCPYFKSRFFVVVVIELYKFFIYLNFNPLWQNGLKISPSFSRSPFILLVVSSLCINVFVLCCFTGLFLLLLPLPLGVRSKRKHCQSDVNELIACFLLGICMISGHILEAFELIFVYAVRQLLSLEKPTCNIDSG